MFEKLPGVAQRFIKYVKVDTQSAYVSDSYPSTFKQLNLAEVLVEELKEIGLKDVYMDEFGYVFGTVPANVESKAPKIGFLAHMDTTPEVSGANVKPQVVENYDGNDIVLNKEKNIVLSVEDTPELKNCIGQTMITTDGTTLLGADDKAGIAEIITAAEYLINHPEIPHGTVKVAFTPDEEVGRGVLNFDIKKFDVDFAYTLDGGPLGEYTYETFNAAKADVVINGKNVHPGLSKNKMINSMEILMDLNSMLPLNQRPQYTENREGYFHLLNVSGDVERTEASFYIRDHDKEEFEFKKLLLEKAVEFINVKYRRNVIDMKMEDSYYNMKYILKDKMHIVKTAEKAIEEVGVKPFSKSMRGGTDGAWLTYAGLPTPNIFVGGYNFHSKFECVSVFAMEKASEVIVKIAELYGKTE